jgi:hypothetical protein
MGMQNENCSSVWSRCDWLISTNQTSARVLSTILKTNHTFVSANEGVSKGPLSYTPINILSCPRNSGEIPYAIWLAKGFFMWTNQISAGFFFTLVLVKQDLVRTNPRALRVPLSYSSSNSMFCLYKSRDNLNISTLTLIFLKLKL